MGRSNMLLLSMFSLAIIFAALPSLAAGPEHVYIEGERGHFRLEPGKVYHWRWTEGEKAPEPKAAVQEKEKEKEKEKPETGAKAAVAGKPAARITKEAVESMMREAEAVLEKREIEGIVNYINNYFSPDFIMFLTVETAQGKQSLRFDRDGYIEHMKKRFSKLTYYEYEVKNLTVDVSGNGGNATAEADLYDTYGTRELQAHNTTHQTIALELRDGQLLITKVSAVTK